MTLSSWCSCHTIAWLVTLTYIGILVNTIYGLFNPDLNVGPEIILKSTDLIRPALDLDTQQFDLYVYLSQSDARLSSNQNKPLNPGGFILQQRLNITDVFEYQVNLTIADINEVLSSKGEIWAHSYLNPVPVEAVEQDLSTYAPPRVRMLYVIEPLTKLLKLPLNDSHLLFNSEDSNDSSTVTAASVVAVEELHQHWATKLSLRLVQDDRTYPLSRVPGDIGRHMAKLKANPATPSNRKHEKSAADNTPEPAWMYYPIFWAQQTWLLRTDYVYLNLTESSDPADPTLAFASPDHDDSSGRDNSSPHLENTFPFSVSFEGQSLGTFRLAKQMEASISLLG